MSGTTPSDAGGGRAPHDKLADLRLVQQVFESLEENQDRQAFLDALVESIARLGHIQLCSLMLVDDVGDLVIAASCGLPEAIVASTRISPGEGIAGHVFATGRPLLIEDIGREERFPAAPGLVSYDTRSLLSVPLVCRGRKLGVLNVNNKRDGRPFDEADRDLLSGIARQAALAIENFDLISALQQRTGELEQAHGDLQRIAAGRSRLVCNLSHELKTPLASVLGYLELILEHLEEIGLEEQRAYLERARDAGLHIGELIKGMLLLFSLEKGAERWNPEPVDFRRLLRLRLAERREIMARQEIELVERDTAAAAGIQGDPERLAFLVDALLDHAVRFNRIGGRIVTDLAAGQEAGSPRLVWRLRHDLEQVPGPDRAGRFESAAVLGARHSEEPSGAAVGLSICKAIVDRLGGDISLDTSGGQQAVFDLRIPLAGGEREDGCDE